jgi:hypothetical protein
LPAECLAPLQVSPEIVNRAGVWFDLSLEKGQGSMGATSEEKVIIATFGYHWMIAHF